MCSAGNPFLREEDNDKEIFFPKTHMFEQLNLPPTLLEREFLVGKLKMPQGLSIGVCLDMCYSACVFKSLLN